MSTTAFETFDHESHMTRAIELARESVDRGDRPFGSVLVRDDEVVMEAGNHVNTADDVRRHPELDLAHRAHRQWDVPTRRETVMYTSTEPCPMCTGGIRHAKLGRVVYSVGGDEFDEFVESGPPVRSATILDGVADVVGPVLNAEGRALHEAFGW